MTKALTPLISVTNAYFYYVFQTISFELDYVRKHQAAWVVKIELSQLFLNQLTDQD